MLIYLFRRPTWLLGLGKGVAEPLEGVEAAGEVGAGGDEECTAGATDVTRLQFQSILYHKELLYHKDQCIHDPRTYYPYRAQS